MKASKTKAQIGNKGATPKGKSTPKVYKVPGKPINAGSKAK